MSIPQTGPEAMAPEAMAPEASDCWRCGAAFETRRPEGGLCYGCWQEWLRGLVVLPPAQDRQMRAQTAGALVDLRGRAVDTYA